MQGNYLLTSCSLDPGLDFTSDELEFLLNYDRYKAK